MRRFRVILAATAALAAGSVGAVAATSSATAVGPSAASSSPGISSSGNGASYAAISGLSAKRKKARKKALVKCRKIRKKSRRKACLKRVRKRFRTAPRRVEKPPVAVIDVRDKYFSPDVVDIKSGDTILWVWNDINADAHNVNLVSGPPGVRRLDFSTPSSPSVGFSFKRKFTATGSYQFVCSIHHLMTMQVEVSE